MPQKHPKVAGYTIIEQVGGGGFSVVYKAVNFDEQRVAACKLIETTDKTTEEDIKKVHKEMRIHAYLKHPNVLEFINALVVETKHKAQYIPGIYMLLEYAGGGDLFDKIAADVGVTEDVAHVYFTQLTAGMTYIHGEGICHRDLKPENLMLDAAGNLKITDFGLSSVFMLKANGKQRPLTDRCGSLPYVAPELNFNEPYQAEPIDIWGMGIILYTMLIGNTPWDEPTRHSTEYIAYLNANIFDRPPWSRLPSGPFSLIRGILRQDPNKRLTLPEIREHPWLQKDTALSQNGKANMLAVGESMMETLRTNGDLGIAAPAAVSEDVDMDTDEDGDTIMGSVQQTQFTQTLLLFSQTQNGRRYTPNLTRFYANLAAPLLSTLIHESLISLGAYVKIAPLDSPSPSPHNTTQSHLVAKMRVGGQDMRKQLFKGWVIVERYNLPARGGQPAREGSFILMTRDEGNPISWRQLWKALINSPSVEPHVLRK